MAPPLPGVGVNVEVSRNLAEQAYEAYRRGDLRTLDNALINLFDETLGRNVGATLAERFQPKE